MHHRLIAHVSYPLLGICMWDQASELCCFSDCLSAYTKNQRRPALSIHCCAFIPGMSCLSTGMTGSSTVVAQKLGMSLITMMVVRLTRTTSSPSWMCALPLIHSQQYGTEWRLLGGAGLRNHCFVCYEKTETFFFLRKMLKLNAFITSPWVLFKCVIKLGSFMQRCYAPLNFEPHFPL